jgi:hypothetical protein
MNKNVPMGNGHGGDVGRQSELLYSNISRNTQMMSSHLMVSASFDQKSEVDRASQSSFIRNN